MATSYSTLVRGAQLDLRDNIRDLAKINAWTLADLAREADMKYGLLTQGLSGNRWFTEPEVTALANVLEVAVDELMGESVFKADARGSKFDKPHPARGGVDVGTGYGRALCCECGTFRRFGTGDVDYLKTNVSDGAPDPLGRRMVTTLRCRTCDRATLHAELRHAGEHQDHAEALMYGPTKEQEAIERRDALIVRLAGFNVDVDFRPRRREKHRAEGYLSCYSFDEAKTRWRIEIDPNAPARVQSVALLAAWTAISTDNHNVDWDPRKGVMSSVADTAWEVAVDDLIEDIRSAMPVELQRMRVEIADEVALDNASAEVDR